MSDEAKTETVEVTTQPDVVPEKSEELKIEGKNIIIDGEEYDPERALGLIKKLRPLEKEVGKLTKKVTEFETAEQKRKEAEMSEIDKEKSRADAAEAELKQLKTEKLKREIAEKAGLPAEFADRLRGETPEELEEDAKAFLEKLPKPTPKISTTNPDSNVTTNKKTEMELLQEIKSGGAPGIFSLGGNQSQGGGVFYSPGKQSGVVEGGQPNE